MVHVFRMLVVAAVCKLCNVVQNVSIVAKMAIGHVIAIRRSVINNLASVCIMLSVMVMMLMCQVALMWQKCCQNHQKTCDGVDYNVFNTVKWPCVDLELIIRC